MHMKKNLIVVVIGVAMSLASCSENEEPKLPSADSNTEITDTETMPILRLPPPIFKANT